MKLRTDESYALPLRFENSQRPESTQSLRDALLEAGRIELAEHFTVLPGEA